MQSNDINRCNIINKGSASSGFKKKEIIPPRKYTTRNIFAGVATFLLKIFARINTVNILVSAINMLVKKE